VTSDSWLKLTINFAYTRHQFSIKKFCSQRGKMRENWKITGPGKTEGARALKLWWGTESVRERERAARESERKKEREKRARETGQDRERARKKKENERARERARYRVIPGHSNHVFDPASVLLSTHWSSQHPACQHCFYKPLRKP